MSPETVWISRRDLKQIKIYERDLETGTIQEANRNIPPFPTPAVGQVCRTAKVRSMNYKGIISVPEPGYLVHIRLRLPLSVDEPVKVLYRTKLLQRNNRAKGPLKIEQTLVGGLYEEERYRFFLIA
jgi:hypothetical protein